uniref:Jak n=1 Tax=Penaeus japonicus TaxID=27405 RepID=A0A1L2DC14_PENJP|nr:Jak [Penaeus japonicus]
MLTINFYGSQQPLKMPADSDQTVEDLIIAAARVLEIGPVCRHLFGLRCPDGLWLAISKKLSSLSDNMSLLFRLRFKAHSLQRLRSLDPSAFEYLFNQVRADFHACEIPELIRHPEDGLGLVVTDILLYLLNNPTKKVENVDIKSFMPKELNGFANRLNVKKNVIHYIDTWRDKDAVFVRERYLSKVEERRCSYGTEEYVVQMDEAGKDYTIRLVIDPFHAEFPGLRYTYASQKKGAWVQLCRLEELVFVSTRFQDLTVELSRETGVPCYFKLQTTEQLVSFVGCLNGYYRLLRNWNFDLCQELSTPSLLYLRANKCHGPVGKLFSAKKLKEKGGGEVGVGLVRESTSDHEKYKLDIIIEPDKTPLTFTINREGGKVHLEDKKEDLYDSLKFLLRDLITKDILGVKLSRILPPSDYDYAELLLVCASRDKQVQNNILSGPRIISMDHLTATRQDIKRGHFSDLIRGKWDGLQDTEVAVKLPKFMNASEKESFLAATSKFVFVNCECIVHIFGVALNPLALVMEFFPLGDLSSYLQKIKSIEEVELVEAATYLARALWYLNQEGIQHSNIRCHNILVAEHTDQTFKVKLGDPGVVRYTEKDIHWIPREHHNQPDMAIKDITTDIWAFSTTLWQIFSKGKDPLPGADLGQVKKLYEAGCLLPRPDLCPIDLYKVMERCWSRDPQARRQPQAIMRDVNQILYQVFNSRKNHSYQTIYRASTSAAEDDEEEDNSNDLDDENGSITTQVTTLTLSDGTTTEFVVNEVPGSFVDDLISIGSNFYPMPMAYNDAYSESASPDAAGSTFAENLTSEKKLSELLLPPLAAQRLPEVPHIPSEPLQLYKSDITFDIKIGEGYYGVVYRGEMKDPSGRVETVAIKTLKAAGQIEDHMREINIMKKLDHKNVVRLCGLCEGDGEELYMIMEYLKEGSLRAYIIRCKDQIEDRNLLKFALDIAEVSQFYHVFYDRLFL